MKNILRTVIFLLAAAHVTAAWAAVLPETDLAENTRIVCPVEYPKEHLQGIACNEKYIYWVFSKHLVKTDLTGKLFKAVTLHKEPGRSIHGGSPALTTDRLYVPYCASGFNKKLNGKPSLNYVQIYDLDLNYIKSIPVPELEYGAGALSTDGKSFFITGGRPMDMPGNVIYEFSRDFKLLKKHKLSFNTFKGIQTFACSDKYFYAGCYGSEYLTYRISRDFKKIDYLKLYTYVGAAPLANDLLLAAGIELNSEGREETFVKVVNPGKYLQKTAVIELDKKGSISCGGRKIQAVKLRNIIRNMKCDFTVLRCPESTQLCKIVELQVFIPGRFIIEFYK